MVTKKRSSGEKEAKKGRVKVDKLKLNKETVKNLTSSDARKVKGGNLAEAAVKGAANVVGEIKLPTPQINNPTPYNNCLTNRCPWRV